MRLHRRTRGDRGAVAVEFALIVPLLLILVFGIVNFAVILSQQLALNNGVRQGTRLAVVAGNVSNQSCGQVVTSTQQTSGPAIAMNTSQIKVRVQRVNSATLAPASPEPCFSGALVTSPTGTGSSTRVCAANSGDNSVRTQAEYPARFIVPIPFFPTPTITLRATAVYRCEFSS
jgi:Flp pilus assembly protein TadG